MRVLRPLPTLRAVREKKAVESELLKEVEPVDVAGEPAPTATAATSATAPIPLEAKESKMKSATPEPVRSDNVVGRVEEEKHPIAVASTPSQAQQPVTVPPTIAVEATPERKGIVTAAPDSRDVSPMSKPVAKPVDAAKSKPSANAPPTTAATTSATAKNQVTPRQRSQYVYCAGSATRKYLDGYSYGFFQD